MNIHNGVHNRVSGHILLQIASREMPFLHSSKDFCKWTRISMSMRYIQNPQAMLGLPCHVEVCVQDHMPQLAFEQTPIMLLQCRRKLLNVRWPYT